MFWPRLIWWLTEMYGKYFALHHTAKKTQLEECNSFCTTKHNLPRGNIEAIIEKMTDGVREWQM